MMRLSMSSIAMYALVSLLVIQLPCCSLAVNSWSNTHVNSNSACTVTIGDIVEHETSHRRLVTNNIDSTCESSTKIDLVIPYQKIKRSFTRVSTKSRRDRDVTDKSIKYTSWVGEDDDGSSFHFVQDEEGHMAASFVDMTEKNVVQIHTKEGKPVATITPSGDFPLEGEPPNKDWWLFDQERRRKLKANPFKLNPSQPNTTPRSQTDSSRRLYDDSGGNIDVMVVWTAQAACVAFGLSAGCTITADVTANMEALVTLAVAESNTSYKASGVPTELLLVESYQHPTYVESSFLGVLEDAESNDMGDIHENRLINGADVVHFIVDLSDICGLGYLGPSISFMYSASYWQCSTGLYSFGHEIAHNYGLLHDRGQEQACGVEGYNFGYRDPNAQLRTVMAYDCVTGECDNNAGGGCPRVARFSTPDFDFNGVAIGEANTADAARAITEVLPEVAAYYEHGLFITEAPSTTPSVSLNPTAAPCFEGETDFKLEFRSDDYPEENSWSVEGLGTTYATGTGYTGRNKKYIEENCFNSTICYEFSFNDEFGDGLLFTAGFTLYIDNQVALRDTGSGFKTLTTAFGGCTNAPTFSPPTTSPSPLPTMVPTSNNFTAVPSFVPTITSSPTAPNLSPAPSIACVNTDLRFRFEKTTGVGDYVRRSCEWVGRFATKFRCKMASGGVALMCPVTCDTCSKCADGPLRFRFREGKKMITRSCIWVANKATKVRCEIPGVKEICRSTCGVC